MSDGSWPMVPLGEVLTPVSRPEAVDPTKEYRLLGARWYALGLYVKDTLLGSQIRAPKVYRVEHGDFVYNRLFAWKGSFALASDHSHGCYVSNEFPCFQVNRDRLDGMFLWRYLSREPVWTEALGLSTGGTPTSRNRLKEEKLLRMTIPLPPLSEQRRIVAKIDQLAAKIEEARGLCSHAQTESSLLPTRAAAMVIDAQPWPEKPLELVLTEGSRNGLSARPSDSPPGLPILRISAGTSRTDAIVEETDYKYLAVSDQEKDTYMLRPGDVLACRFNGNLSYVGRFSLFTGSTGETRLYPDKLIRFRFDSRQVLPEFARYAMNTPKRRTIIEGFCATTAGNIGVSAKDLKSVPVPLPPIEEQRRIVEYLDGLQAKVDRLKELQAATAAELDALLPSILDKAFKGEL